MFGCSGAIDVASLELMLVTDSVVLAVVAGESIGVGWLTDLCGTTLWADVDTFRGVSEMCGVFLVGEL